MANGFLQGPDGNNSNGRLIADFLIVCATIMSFAFIYIGVKYPTTKLMDIALAIGVLFGSIAGSALISLFGHKRTEVKEMEAKATAADTP